MFLLRITKATLVRDMWMVWLQTPAWSHTDDVRLIPANDHPQTCPGGIWCKDFNCEEV